MKNRVTPPDLSPRPSPLPTIAIGAGVLGALGLVAAFWPRRPAGAPSVSSDPAKAAQEAAEKLASQFGVDPHGAPAAPGPSTEAKVAAGVKTGAQVAGAVVSAAETIQDVAEGLGGLG